MVLCLVFISYVLQYEIICMHVKYLLDEISSNSYLISVRVCRNSKSVLDAAQIISVLR